MLRHCFDPSSIHLSLCLLRSRPQTSRDGGVSVQAHSHRSSLAQFWNVSLACFSLTTTYRLKPAPALCLAFLSCLDLILCFVWLPQLWLETFSLKDRSYPPVEKTSSSYGGNILFSQACSLSRFGSCFLFLFSSWTLAGPSHPCLSSWNWRERACRHIYTWGAPSLTRRCIFIQESRHGFTLNHTQI